MAATHVMPPEDHLGVERIDLSQFVFTTKLLSSIPSHVVRRYRLLPVVDAAPFALRVAVAHPIDWDAVDSLHRVLNRELEVCVADRRQLDEFIDRLYGSN